ncbi:MAG: four-helix bundle copper-binding protein [Desulfuromonadales bacterium]|nr:four-helix bundle copper-binding protein [Desulfuromonadales bacterium]
MRLEEMLSTHPRPPQMGVPEITAFIRTCFECADVCLSCADACLSEEQVQSLVRCIRLNQDCADICEVTGKLFFRQTEADAATFRAQLEACIAVCRACAAECDKHADMHEHCRICAEACQECLQACVQMQERYPSPSAGAIS